MQGIQKIGESVLQQFGLGHEIQNFEIDAYPDRQDLSIDLLRIATSPVVAFPREQILVKSIRSKQQMKAS